MSGIKCGICPHSCIIEKGQTGFCKVRYNNGSRIVSGSYGKITYAALDPIEKKPLKHFYPGAKIFSIGSYGCNFRCPFCQNHKLSMSSGKDLDYVYAPPMALVKKAEELVKVGNIGIAYTYNEPLINYEYVRDCSRMAAAKGLKNVLATNGYINQEPLLNLLPFIDAMNIDLKGFRSAYYESFEGTLAPVMEAIAIANERCHVEVTTLIVPGENDSVDEIKELACWLSGVNEEIPLHISRFFPQHRMRDKEATSSQTVLDLVQIAKEYLKNVYPGNIL